MSDLNTLLREARGLVSQLLAGDQWVLLVDPTNQSREAIKTVFNSLGADNILTAPNIGEARRLVITKKVALIVAEWMIPGSDNGLDFCKEIRSTGRLRDIPFLLVTSENMKYDVIVASEVGVSRYILKPFSFETFVKKIRGLLLSVLYPDPRDALITRAEHFLFQGDLENAENFFREAQKVSPGSAKPMYGLAMIYFMKGKMNHAQFIIKNALQLSPEWLDLHHLLLRIYQENGNRNGLVKQAKYLQYISPDNPRYSLLLANEFLHEKNLELAEEYFRKALFISDKLAVAFRGIGEVSLAKRDYKKANKNFLKALNLDPEDVSTLNSIGLSYVKLGDVKSAIQKYLLALKVDPGNEKVLFNLGQAYEKQNRFEDAKNCYITALNRVPDYQKALKALSRIEEVLEVAPVA